MKAKALRDYFKTKEAEINKRSAMHTKIRTFIMAESGCFLRALLQSCRASLGDAESSASGFGLKCQTTDSRCHFATPTINGLEFAIGHFIKY